MADHTISIFGWGSEVAVGTITQEQFDYWDEQGTDDLSEHVFSEEDAPEDVAIGTWYEADDIVHIYGAELVDNSTIEIADDDGDVVWDCTLSVDALESEGVKVTCDGKFNFDDDSMQAGCYFFGQTTSKGGFFDAALEVEEFDPTLLAVSYIEVDGQQLLTSITYNGESVDDEGNSSSNGKGSDFKVVKIE